MFPRPVAGALRPVVRGQTVKYNLKKRYGRGFTLDELKVKAVKAVNMQQLSTAVSAFGQIPTAARNPCATLLAAAFC